MDKTTDRPRFLNLIQIRMPIAAVLSILHRVSGIFLFIALPFVVYFLEASLTSASGFSDVKKILSYNVVQIIVVGLLWLFIHHFFAGIRFLLIDVDIGVAKHHARASAWFVLLAAIIGTLIFIGILL